MVGKHMALGLSLQDPIGDKKDSERNFALFSCFLVLVSGSSQNCAHLCQQRGLLTLSGAKQQAQKITFIHRKVDNGRSPFMTQKGLRRPISTTLRQAVQKNSNISYRSAFGTYHLGLNNYTSQSEYYKVLEQLFTNLPVPSHLRNFRKIQIIWPHPVNYEIRISGNEVQDCSFGIINSQSECAGRYQISGYGHYYFTGPRFLSCSSTS